MLAAVAGLAIGCRPDGGSAAALPRGWRSAAALPRGWRSAAARPRGWRSAAARPGAGSLRPLGCCSWHCSGGMGFPFHIPCLVLWRGCSVIDNNIPVSLLCSDQAGSAGSSAAAAAILFCLVANICPLAQSLARTLLPCKVRGGKVTRRRGAASPELRRVRRRIWGWAGLGKRGREGRRGGRGLGGGPVAGCGGRAGTESSAGRTGAQLGCDSRVAGARLPPGRLAGARLPPGRVAGARLPPGRVAAAQQRQQQRQF